MDTLVSFQVLEQPAPLPEELAQAFPVPGQLPPPEPQLAKAFPMLAQLPPPERLLAKVLRLVPLPVPPAQLPVLKPLENQASMLNRQPGQFRQLKAQITKRTSYASNLLIKIVWLSIKRKSDLLKSQQTTKINKREGH